MMTDAGTFKLDARQLAGEVTLTARVEHARTWWIVASIGLCLIRLGAWLGGFQVELGEGNRDRSA